VTIVCYISSHGFGHATRAVEVLNHTLARQPDARIVVRTAVPAWFIERSAHPAIEIQPCETDTGMAQIDSLRVDEAETARRAARFYRDFPARIEAEARALADLGASIVVGDIPPLAFPAAARAHVPSIAMGNFTWDWIYRAYDWFEPRAPGVIDTIADAYATATLALRMPFAGGFAPMLDVTMNVPLVARRSRRTREDTRRLLEIDATRPVVLASFGGHGTLLPLRDVARDNDLTLVATELEMGDASEAAHEGRLRYVSSDALQHRQLRYEDLVAAADVVVSKPGYGIVSECIANGVALLYTSRGEFAENDVIVDAMHRVMRCRFIKQPDLREGRWQADVEALLRQPPPPETMRTDGAPVVAAAILGAAASR
jgi:L-arabinokinase